MIGTMGIASLIRPVYKGIKAGRAAVAEGTTNRFGQETVLAMGTGSISNGVETLTKKITEEILRRGKVVGKVAQEGEVLVKVAGDTGGDFSGMLRGEKVELPGVKIKGINYTKRNPLEAEKLRKVFDSTERKKFLRDLAQNIEKLKKSGLTDLDIARMKDGLNPKGWQVHHKLPLDDGGTNAMENLILIKNEPYHKTITNYQNTFAKQLNIGETKIIEWPIPEGKIYPPNN